MYNENNTEIKKVYGIKKVKRVKNMKKRITVSVILAMLISSSAAFGATKTHTVISGDSLWKIAVKYKIGISEIIKANPKIENPDLIYPGQVITISGTDEAVLDYENEVIKLVNNIRAKNGLAELKANWELSRIARYKSQDMKDKGNEDQVISYTDITGVMMKSVKTITNAVSYVLIAFVAISLIVSSIMIGVITYISVLERTKEIGILRAIGASKRDISRIFNAETIIVGLIAGVIGIGASLLLLIPINKILIDLTKIAALKAILPPIGGVILILISVFLTYIAGLIPSGMAARKDPVVALRTE